MRTVSLHKRGRRGRGRRFAGAEILELALCLPILLGVAFATVQFGYQLYVMHTIQAAAREGARAAAPPFKYPQTDPPNFDLDKQAGVARAKVVMKSGGFADGDYDANCDVAKNNGVYEVTVTVTMNAQFISKLVCFPGLGRPSSLAAKVVMLKEG